MSTSKRKRETEKQMPVKVKRRTDACKVKRRTVCWLIYFLNVSWKKMGVSEMALTW